MKLILYVNFEKVKLGARVRNQTVKLMKRKQKKLEKKQNIKMSIENDLDKSMKVISEADTFENIDKMKREWEEMFGFKDEEAKKNLKMGLKDKAQLARGKLTKGVKKKALWITGKFNVKYRYEIEGDE